MKRPATAAARRLHKALSALVERGVNGERTNAQAKLERLVERFDFTQQTVSSTDLFKGVFQKSTYAVEIGAVPDMDIASAVKWAIEGRTGIRCLFKGANILAEATPGTARTLEGITTVIADGFDRLWRVYASAGGLAADRNCFLLGLFEGMMNEERKPGQPLPSRATNRAKPNPEDMVCRLPRELQHFADFNRAVEKKFDEENGRVTWIRYFYKGKRIAQSAPDLNQIELHRAFYKLQGKHAKALARAPGLAVHPYSLAVDYGKQLRFSVPVATVERELQDRLTPQIGNTP